MERAAAAATVSLERYEPNLGPRVPDDLILEIQKDVVGQTGDVRDILSLIAPSGWEIGFSVKWNHDAVKHSRLSNTIDFGSQWFGVSCSSRYFTEIAPIFARLEMLIDGGKLWKNVSDKLATVYVPLLKAFVNELGELAAAKPKLVAPKLVEYLIGRHDFYKVIAKPRSRRTEVEAYNLKSKLGKGASSSYRPSRVPLPTGLSRVLFKEGSQTTILVELDKGWQISMRIHSASSRVEPSLKFDIKLVGVPKCMTQFWQPWD